MTGHVSVSFSISGSSHRSTICFRSRSGLSDNSDRRSLGAASCHDVVTYVVRPLRASSMGNRRLHTTWCVMSLAVKRLRGRCMDRADSRAGNHPMGCYHFSLIVDERLVLVQSVLLPQLPLGKFRKHGDRSVMKQSNHLIFFFHYHEGLNDLRTGVSVSSGMVSKDVRQWSGRSLLLADTPPSPLYGGSFLNSTRILSPWRLLIRKSRL